jgi:hypothetical protein
MLIKMFLQSTECKQGAVVTSGNINTQGGLAPGPTIIPSGGANG